MRSKLFVLLIFIAVNTIAQFPGIVGSPGTTAMPKDSIAFVAWGKLCNVTKGYQDISNTSLGYVNVGDSSKVIGKADGSIVSLGDGGSAVVTFSAPIKNDPGFDFAVFENSFSDTFLELAFVEVSSDGVNYFRFPATSNSQYTVQYGNSASIDATKLDNLAGKYRALYGTPFDLQELTGIPQLNINAITHVKIIDVVGSINPTYATYDKNNNIVNDPWPTGFGTSGFDLDAVGVINQAAVGINDLENNDFVKVYPNPANEMLNVELGILNGKDSKITITNALGQIMLEEISPIQHPTFNVQHFPQGIYFVHIENGDHHNITKLIKN